MKVEAKAIKAKIKDLEEMKTDFLQSSERYNEIGRNNPIIVKKDDPASVRASNMIAKLAQEYIFVCQMVEYLVGNYGYQLNFDSALIEFLEKEALTEKANEYVASRIKDFEKTTGSKKSRTPKTKKQK